MVFSVTPKIIKVVLRGRCEDAVAPPREPYKGRKNRQGEVKPLGAVVLYTDLLFQLPPTLTTSSATQVRGSDSIGYEVCGYAAKDHLKINEGEGKEKNGPVV